MNCTRCYKECGKQLLPLEDDSLCPVCYNKQIKNNPSFYKEDGSLKPIRKDVQIFRKELK